jgi:hypothetical protein
MHMFSTVAQEFGINKIWVPSIVLLFISMKCLFADRRLLNPDCVLNALCGWHIERYSTAELRAD